MHDLKTTRRHFLGAAALGAAGSLFAPRASANPSECCDEPATACASTTKPRYQVAVCDWMILKRQKLGAFTRTQEIGADGLELDMGGLGNRPTFDSKLLDPIDRRKFLDAAAQTGVQISSIAMSGFYAQDFASRDIAPMVRDTINTMNLMGVRTAFLPLGVQGDLNQHPEKRPAIVERLKQAGAMAEAARVVIGIETALDAAQEKALLDEIGSPGIRSYFNFANALQNGRNLIGELQTLGKEYICQIHCTDEDKVWLENNDRLDLPAVKAALDAMDWSGWLVLERSRDATRATDVVYNFGANARYVKKVFQGA